MLKHSVLIFYNYNKIRNKQFHVIFFATTLFRNQTGGRLRVRAYPVLHRICVLVAFWYSIRIKKQPSKTPKHDTIYQFNPFRYSSSSFFQKDEDTCFTLDITLFFMSVAAGTLQWWPSDTNVYNWYEKTSRGHKRTELVTPICSSGNALFSHKLR